MKLLIITVKQYYRNLFKFLSYFVLESTKRVYYHQQSYHALIYKYVNIYIMYITSRSISNTLYYEKPNFFIRWFMSTNHKDIGILYIFTAALFGFISVAFTVYMRLELMEPGVQYMTLDGQPNGHLWNVLITGHGVLMMFFVVIHFVGGFGNYFMPLMIGAPDMASQE